MRAFALACAVLVACRPAPTVTLSETDTAPTPVEPKPPAAAPEVVVETLEQRLLAARRVHVVFEVESHGGVETDLRGILVIASDGRALLEAQGTFDGKAGVARIECDGTTLRGTSGAAKLEMPCPAALQPALVLGLVRMGVLHNLARTWMAKPPDRAELPPGETDGAAPMNAWVTTQAHRRPPGESAPASGDVIAFDIAVDGQNVGEASLQLGASGLPETREQTVRFPGGEMQVVERYETFEIDGAAPESPRADASVVGKWSSPSCRDRTYVRELELAADGTFRSDDLVSPCPKGAVCVWSGIVHREGTYAVAGDRVTLATPPEKRPQARPLPAVLGVEGGVLVEGESCRYQRIR